MTSNEAKVFELTKTIEQNTPNMAPQPLPESLPPVPKFDPDMLPDEIRGYVMDASNRLQCPPEYCAVIALGLLSGVMGHKVRMRPKQKDHWEIVPILWTVIIGGPSAMKSPAINEMSFPIDAMEADSRKAHEQAVAEYERDKDLFDIERKNANKKAADKIKNGDKEAAKAELDRVSAPTQPEPRLRFLVNDATVEALGELMNEQPHHLTLFRDELAGFLEKLQAEEAASERTFYLEAWNGKRSFTYDRIGRGTVFIEHNALHILGGIQPTKLAPIVRSARGAVNDGLIQRFQMAVWPDPYRGWHWVDERPDPRAREHYSQVFYRLHNLEFPAGENGDPPAWHFSLEAQEYFIEWMTSIQCECRSEDISPLMAEHLLKMPQTVGTLSLLFAVIDGEQGSIGVSSLLRALSWANYLRDHAERLYSAATNRDIEGAKVILKRRDKLPNPFNPRIVVQKGWQGLDTTQAVRNALAVLVEHHHLTELETPTSGRTRMDYYWHSSLVKKAKGA